MQIFTITCLITFLWLVFGYSLAFSPAQLNGKVNEVYGNADRLWLRGMMTKTSHALAPTIPEAIFCAYQLTFAIITAGLICGSFADRMKYHSMIIFITFWHLIVYCPIAHSNWHPQGWLYRLGVLDYAGGNVVHICSGTYSKMQKQYLHRNSKCSILSFNHSFLIGCIQTRGISFNSTIFTTNRRNNNL